MHLKNGLYDVLVSEALDAALAELPEGQRSVGTLEPREAALALAEAAGRQLARLLDELKSSSSEDQRGRLLESANLVNSLLVHARSIAEGARFDPERIAVPPKRLLAIGPEAATLVRPETGLSAPWLFAAGKDAPALLEELRREIASADRIDILVSFITVSGVRKIMDLLERAAALDADGNARLKLRVLTTTYTGATQQSALDRIGRLPGAEVRVSLDGRRTRLHAKAWIFHRESGFGCAYAGSANLSASALTGGLEWTIKFTERGQSEVFERARSHFETLWHDSEFQRYDPDDPASREALRLALIRERGGSTQSIDSEPAAFFFGIEPKSYQAEMLDELAAERGRGRFRNLLVAATGTGKTIVAALDYRRTCEREGGRPRLLFVAHRAEILKQARRAFREVLRDHSFGEILAEGGNPASYDHLFATINSVSSRSLSDRFGTEHWHTVIFDECHRMAADSFDRLARALTPRIFLGLTATPERSDGKPIAPYFDMRPDGSPAAELRLWTALDLQLLAPFEYYGCDDDTDFSGVPWDRAAAEEAALDRLLTGNEVRARLVVDEWERLSGGARSTRALAFCVSVAHARYMTERFKAAGLPSVCLVGDSDPALRSKAPGMLERGEICAIVTCDLFNEGIDIPSVDTILLLRPTQSPVLFQQQIGRGLRLDRGKEACLVLDFVGRFRTDFRIETLLRSITGLSRRELEQSVEHGFDRLPPGCHIHLEKQARETVLRNIRAVTNESWPRLRAELERYAVLNGRDSVRLAGFLYDQKLELGDIYRSGGNSGWTALKRAAGLVREPPGPEEEYYGRRLFSLLHLDDAARIGALRLMSSGLAGSGLDVRARTLLQMLAYQVDGDARRIGSFDAFLQRLDAYPAIKAELTELTEVLQEQANGVSIPVPGLEDTPLSLHASYSRREILTAVGLHTASARPSYREGVLPMHDRKLELFFVTLDKREGFHEAIAYHDYAISPELFHWQSQNAAGPDTGAGRRYIDSPGNGWTFQLFVRIDKDHSFKACGPVALESWSGDRPLSIVWKLAASLPASLYREFSVLRDA
ncbi:MAG: DUF3427 domain-containing protein [Spirochaetales bacterium]|nr:DUF3427 domain-containing protein [Spirochaetales bacterium]